MRIVSKNGVRVNRAAQSWPKELTEQATSAEKSSTGMAALDTIMGGGVYDGSITLVGISGTGKTVMGDQFLTEGAKQGNWHDDQFRRVSETDHK